MSWINNCNASIWTVSAIGLAVGVGFYFGAVLTTFLILLTLITFNKLEGFISKRKLLQPLILVVKDIPGQLGKVGSSLGQMNINIKDVKMENIGEDKLMITLMIQKINGLVFADMEQRLKQIDEIYDIKTKI